MQIKKNIKKGSYLFISLIMMTLGCKKESEITKTAQVEKDPVAAIRSIVGNKGTISILKNQQNFNLSSSKKDEVLKDSNLRILSIQEFKKLYQELNTIEFVQIGLDSNLNQKKSSSEYADDNYDDDPGKPGLHKVQFYAAPWSYFNGTYGINNSNLPLSILNLWYETDIYGRVVGTPVLFYTGVSLLQNWTQLLVTNIQFNQNNYTSSFSIGGTNLYGINVLGQNIGWTSSSRYIITVSMDSNFGEDGKVNIKTEQN
jgi:hypothetical protein